VPVETAAQLSTMFFDKKNAGDKQVILVIHYSVDVGEEVILDV
jgi:hypothetical protein